MTIYDLWPSAKISYHILIFFILVREKERKREKYLEGGPEGEHRAPEQRQRRRVIFDLRSAMRGELRRRGDVTVGFWVWFAGAWFRFVYWGFFF